MEHYQVVKSHPAGGVTVSCFLMIMCLLVAHQSLTTLAYVIPEISNEQIWMVYKIIIVPPSLFQRHADAAITLIPAPE